MAKISRITQLLFGSSGLTPSGGFGAPAAGNVNTEIATSNTPANIMSGPSWLTGWLTATLGASKFPTVEDQNASLYAITSQLAYLFQQGIAEYDSATTYYANSVCIQTGTYNVYGSVTNANVGNALTNPTYWTFLGSLSNLGSATSPVQGEFKNLKIATTSNTSSTITADALIVQNSAGNTLRLTSINQSYSTAASGAGGVDAGSIATSTWYYEYIIYNATSSTISSLLSLSSTAPTLPSGYTYFARVGAIYYDSGSKLRWKLQYGRRVQILSGNNPTSLPIMASGTAGNPSTPTLVAISVSSFVPTTASRIILSYAFNSSSTANQGIISPNNTGYGSFASTTNAPPVGWASTSGAGGGSDNIAEFALESTNIYWASTHTTQSQIYSFGWEDNL